MPGNIGPLEIAVVLIIVLIIFGPKRLPELGRSIGRGIREFRKSIGGGDDKDDSDQKRRELEAAEGSESTSEPETASAGAGVTPGTTTPAADGEQKPAADAVEGEVVTDKRA